MRPPYAGSLPAHAARAGGHPGIPTTLRMILRNMERRPLRTLLAVGGVAIAVAIVILGNFFATRSTSSSIPSSAW